MLRAKSKAPLCIYPLCEQHRGSKAEQAGIFILLVLGLVKYEIGTGFLAMPAERAIYFYKNK